MDNALRILKHITVCITIVWLFSGCVADPPHDNPIDPESPGFVRTGNLKLQVQTIDRTPIDGASVRLPELDRYGQTDDLGEAVLENLPDGTWWVVSFRDNNPAIIFGEDSIQVEIIGSRTVEAAIQLIAIEERGNLTVRVVDLIDEPITGAMVLVSELGRYAFTDTQGLVWLDLLPVGEWWVSAFKNGESLITYVTDSVRTSITSAADFDTTMRLDALPHFDSTLVYSITEENDDGIEFKLHLSAQVEDPDGQFDLTDVYWKTLYLPPSSLHYQPDSAFWWSELPTDSFQVEGLDNLLGKPFYFEAIDRAGKSSRSDATYLWRVIHETPQIDEYPPQYSPITLEWDFDAIDFNRQRDSTQYNFLIRLWKGIPADIAHTWWVAPDGFHNQSITVDLAPDTYDWEVFVVDRFGNTSRSRQFQFTIRFPAQ